MVPLTDVQDRRLQETGNNFLLILPYYPFTWPALLSPNVDEAERCLHGEVGLTLDTLFLVVLYHDVCQLCKHQPPLLPMPTFALKPPSPGHAIPRYAIHHMHRQDPAARTVPIRTYLTTSVRRGKTCGSRVCGALEAFLMIGYHCIRNSHSSLEPTHERCRGKALPPGFALPATFHSQSLFFYYSRCNMPLGAKSNIDASRRAGRKPTKVVNLRSKRTSANELAQLLSSSNRPQPCLS